MESEAKPNAPRTMLRLVVWLSTVAVAVVASLGYIYTQYQTPERYQTSATFRVEPPLSILNMQPVDRDKYSGQEVGRHLEGLRK